MSLTIEQIKDSLYGNETVNKLMTNRASLPKSQSSELLINRIDALAATISRFGMLPQIGKDTYNGERDIYKTLGYPETISFDDYYNRYKRQGLATAIINKPVTSTWSGEVGITGTADTKDKKGLDSLISAWKVLENKIKIKMTLARLDKIAGLGGYALLFLGFDDTPDVESLQKPVSDTVKNKLIFMKPIAANAIQITQWESNPTKDRYGRPYMYQILLNQEDEAPVSDISSYEGTALRSSVLVHHSRVLHVPANLFISELYGAPRLENVYNNLIDIEKISGGDGEMFWRGARPGYQGIVDKDFQITPEVRNGLENQLDEWEHNLRRFMVNQGIKMEPMGGTVTDPKNHLDIQLQLVSAGTETPKRILIGSESGELASTQDQENFRDIIKNRRQEYAEPIILRPLIDMLMEYGALPRFAEEYAIRWSELYSPSEKEIVEIGKSRATSLALYAKDTNAQQILPIKVFLKEILRLDAGALDEVAKLGGVDKPLPPEIKPTQSSAEQNERDKIEKQENRPTRAEDK